ncbi:hypothetical protein THRCLA_05029 [Thraustotheca clavata]|uniref:Uncharacterized protein n=1 Tax=Thraustotheca clavata TaxID=74557 RepID=A0A1V9ZX65_9STRA|nr:hypothetical protein THRCLA_05029 [Thraustotheca clavata]
MPPHEQSRCYSDIVVPEDVVKVKKSQGKLKRHHPHSHLRMLFLLLMSLVITSVITICCMMERLRLESSLHSVLNGLLNADLIHSHDGFIFADMDRHHKKSLRPLDIECKLLGTLYMHLAARQSHDLMEILRGAHVIVQNDNGFYYSHFQNLSSNIHFRFSSHYSIVQQYAIPQGPLLDTILLGITHDNSSWFQFEGAAWDPFTRPMDSLIHVLNYFEYTFRRVQIGPLGTSIHTDQSPLVIPFRSFNNIKQD